MVSRAKPKGGARAVRPVLEPRPVVRSEGELLEVVWFAHRDAASLLPGDYPSIDGARQVGYGLTRRIQLTRGERKTGGSQ